MSIPPKYSVSETVGFIEGRIAIKVFDLHHPLKKRYWGRHFWALGYWISTVGVDEEQAQRHVKHHLEQDKRLEEL